jgi:hypothetical protein
VCVSIHTTFNGKVAQRLHHFDLLYNLLQRTVRPSDIIMIAGDLNCDVAHQELPKITAHPCVSELSRVALPGPTFTDKDGQHQTIDHIFHSPSLRVMRIDVEAVAPGKPYGPLESQSGVASVVAGSDHSWAIAQFGFVDDTPSPVPEQLERLEELARRLEAQVFALETASASGHTSDSFKASVLTSLHHIQAIVKVEEAQRTEVRWPTVWIHSLRSIIRLIVFRVCAQCCAMHLFPICRFSAAACCSFSVWLWLWFERGFDVLSVTKFCDQV